MKIVLAVWLVWWALAFLPPIVVHLKLRMPFVAMTIAPLIIHNSSYKMESWTLKHEKRHASQQRCLSPAVMLLLYLLFSAVLFVYFLPKERNFYRAYWRCYFLNPFEIDARINGGWYR